jgi:hypothetical protein
MRVLEPYPIDTPLPIPAPWVFECAFEARDVLGPRMEEQPYTPYTVTLLGPYLKPDTLSMFRALDSGHSGRSDAVGSGA